VLADAAAAEMPPPVGYETLDARVCSEMLEFALRARVPRRAAAAPRGLRAAALQDARGQELVPNRVCGLGGLEGAVQALALLRDKKVLGRSSWCTWREAPNRNLWGSVLMRGGTSERAARRGSSRGNVALSNRSSRCARQIGLEKHADAAQMIRQLRR
jgi:hypothetical protein